MNPNGELWHRAAVVTVGTVAVLVLASATVAVLPFRLSEHSSPHPQAIETGLVELPPQPAAPSRARRQAQVPPPAEPPPPPPAAEPPRQLPPPAEPPSPPPAPQPPRSLPPEPAPKPEVQEPRPFTHEPEQPKTPPPRMTSSSPSEQAQPVAPPPPTEPARKERLTGEPAQKDGLPGGSGAAGAVFKPSPIIPPELRLHALDLVAVVRFTIATDGTATVELQEATADPQINQILLDTFRRWRFFPAMQGGKPVVSTLVLRVPIKVE